MAKKDYTIDGADIKIPWEVARLKRLLYLALLYESKPNKYHYLPNEIKLSINHFILENKIGTGINWRCPGGWD
ncbi:hypothetical protein OK016_10450 [Vibrio chagasii]|nr:hypothetical protein [Vibrio chagasii]